MQIKGTECINTTLSIEEHLHKEVSDPVDLKSMEMTVPDQHEPSSNQPEQVFKDDEESKGHFSEDKVDAGASDEARNRRSQGWLPLLLPPASSSPSLPSSSSSWR